MTEKNRLIKVNLFVLTIGQPKITRLKIRIFLNFNFPVQSINFFLSFKILKQTKLR